MYVLAARNPYPLFFHIKLARRLVLSSSVISVLMCASVLYFHGSFLYIILRFEQSGEMKLSDIKNKT